MTKSELDEMSNEQIFMRFCNSLFMRFNTVRSNYVCNIEFKDGSFAVGDGVHPNMAEREAFRDMRRQLLKTYNLS